GKVIFDFSESDPQCDFINVPLGQVWSSVTAGFLWCLPPGLPRNKGFFDCMEVITKEGTCLSPVYPATAASQAVTLGLEITECVMLAMAQVDPKESPATWGRHVNPLYAGKRRDKIDPRTGSIMEYTAHTFHAVASSGAAMGFDAVDGNGSTPLGGAMVRAPIEVEEWMIPYRWLHYEFLTDSCGHGRWRGGLGTHVEAQNIYDKKVWQPLDCLTMSGNADGERFSSVGLQGGTGGTKTKLEVIRKGKHIRYRTFDLMYLEPGDILVSNSGGGGGVGDPLDREVEKVRFDAMNEYISMKTAKNVYGVVLDPKTFKVNEKATAALRARLKSKKSSQAKTKKPKSRGK
ncbi:MAG TPA: hydantoinase B/oxoprolinase family protein, partial [Syntrophorhabdales bacterium]|nr:hydantoinase B/oxoprolinase family protein [Syntrophorhabdales bacterium]